MNNKAQSRISELDSLRAIAALSVMFFHYTYGFNHGDSHTFFHKGFMGVELFFVISGFVIFMTLQNTEKPKQFIVSRFARLYPAYWFSVIMSFILFSIPFFLNTQVQPNFKITSISFGRFLANLSMLQSYFGIEHIDGVYWTLSVELVFYIIVLLIFCTKKLKYIELIGWGYVFLLFFTHRYVKSIDLTFIRYGLYFLAGIVYFHIYKDGINLKKNFTLYLLLLATLLLNLKYFYYNLTEQLIVGLIYLIFIFLSLHKLEWLRFKPLIFLGQISYSMYLLHENIGFLLFNLFDFWGIHNIWAKIFVTMFLIIVISKISYHLFENLARKKIVNILNR